MSDEARRKVQEMWPRPRVGQKVRTRSGKVGDVISVTKARDVIRSQTEVNAALMSPRLRATFGEHWLDVYYEADVIFPGSVSVQRISTMDVEEVFDPD